MKNRCKDCIYLCPGDWVRTSPGVIQAVCSQGRKDKYVLPESVACQFFRMGATSRRLDIADKQKKISAELAHTMREADARERVNNLLQAYALARECGMNPMSVDDLVDMLTPTGGHAGIVDRLERERSAHIIRGIIYPEEDITDDNF